MTEYRDIPGFPGYRVGDDGSVWCCLKRGASQFGSRIGTVWRCLKQQCWGKTKYKMVNLQRRGIGISKNVHRLVLLAFVGPCPPGMECRHLDGNRANNRIDNLRWGTRLENAQDRTTHGTQTRGEKNGSAKLTEGKVLRARKLLSQGKTCASIGRELGVGRTTIGWIKRGRTWCSLLAESST